MTPYTSTLELTKQFVAIPSYVDKDQDESAAQEFLYNYLQKAFPEMPIKKQYLQNSKRFNLILGNDNPELLVVGHIDTVQPKNGWQTDPLVPTVKNNILYGLGAADMKGSLAAFIVALQRVKSAHSLGDVQLAVYIDEEYDFLGMKRLISTAAPSPQQVLSLDGELKLATGCRGLIELRLRAKGRSGHSANPLSGINAITQTVEVLNDVSAKLSVYTDAELGATTTNLAYIKGGVLRQGAKGEYWAGEGNAIADTAEVVFEVRSARREITATYVLEMIVGECKTRKLELIEQMVRHDIPPWEADYSEQNIEPYKKAFAKANVPFVLSDRRAQGYIDAQMIAEATGAPTYIIGTGGNNKHGPNENVPVENLERATRVYEALLKEFL